MSKKFWIIIISVSSGLILIALALFVYFNFFYTPKQKAGNNSTQNAQNIANANTNSPWHEIDNEIITYENSTQNTANTNTNSNASTNSSASTNSQTTPAPAPAPVQNYSEITHGNTSKKQVIFTFDGGSGTQSADTILSVAAKHHVKVTFFLTGKWAQTNSALTKKFAQQGHEVFNHTYDHPYLTKISDAQIKSELKQAEDIISGLTGKTTKPYFRAPYGSRNQHVKDIAQSQGYRSVFWSVDALDWKESSGQTAQQVKDKILSNVKPGNIFLMHIGDNLTGQVLDSVFTEIESRGYKIVSLTQGL